MEGVLVGGWGFVAAAYTVVWGGLLVYGALLLARRRAAVRQRISSPVAGGP